MKDLTTLSIEELVKEHGDICFELAEKQDRANAPFYRNLEKRERATLKEARRRDKELSNLRVLVDFHGAVACKKCGAYHLTTHICYRCGHDDSLKD